MYTGNALRADSRGRARTSHTPKHIRGRERGIARGHWTIENRVHYVRDVAWQEDAGQARVGQTCHVLAALRNGLLNLLRGLGHTNIAAALRHYGASVERALRLTGLQT